ncbi:hypothetical protein [Rhizobium giardinii]|uniref:Uncharacterized protein n=1 Tax=Rhizobium giardinii TaxID=56731 RepID=A0A7W8UCL0_9HYPH|nr:hypothetical protein [Rhizobium giardinii]MBB5536896.1 hypothetical protein [Rhizobium giardinii]
MTEDRYDAVLWTKAINFQIFTRPNPCETTGLHIPDYRNSEAIAGQDRNQASHRMNYFGRDAHLPLRHAERF